MTGGQRTGWPVGEGLDPPVLVVLWCEAGLRLTADREAARPGDHRDAGERPGSRAAVVTLRRFFAGDLACPRRNAASTAAQACSGASPGPEFWRSARGTHAEQTGALPTR